MALLLVGFGLRDSSVDIAKLQYHELQLYDANIILNTSASKQEQNNVEQELYWNALPDRKRRCQSKGRKDLRKLYRALSVYES